MADPCECNEPVDIVTDILKINEQLNELNDLDAILDRILQEARKLTNADAGTIYLVNDGKLQFSYVHNDTLMKEGEVNAEIYSNFSIPINDQSIVGYVAGRGELLAIDDAYDMPQDSPVHFNPSFDQKTGYHTTSILTIPIKASQGKVVGIIQIINSKDEAGASVPFSEQSRQFLPIFANSASVAIERAIVTRELILRMMQMAELRDPSETGPHVSRVGAYSAEIYHKWARNKGVDREPTHRIKTSAGATAFALE